jgi:hypothetical protein
MALPAVARTPEAGDHGTARGWEWGHGECTSRPNIGLQATANSLRSFFASAIGGA